MPPLRLFVLLVLVVLGVAPAAQATDVVSSFPTNLLTVADPSQPTGLRVNLPQPSSCAAGHPNDCDDVAVLNSLDGFNVQPRISVRFSGPIDPATATSDTIHLYDTSCLVCAPVGIDQRVWEGAANTLHFESGQFLKEGTTYLLVVTTQVREPTLAATPLERTTFLHDLNFGQTKNAAAKAYRKALKQSLETVGAFETAAWASLFTTQTTTDEMLAIRAQLDAAAPAAATIEASIPLATVTGFTFKRQTTTAPGYSSSTPGGFPAVFAVSGAVGKLVFGSYPSKQYETGDRVIPAVPTVSSTETIEFTLFVPSTPAPAGGYPVALFGHGFGDSKNNSPFAVAAIMASQGIATAAINVVGHGGGPLGRVIVGTLTGPVDLPAGGRSIDQDGNGTFASTEGLNAAPQYAIVGNRDGLRQTVIDLMQLVRVIKSGGIPQLSTSRIYYFGQSLGGIYGTQLLGVDPLIRAGVPNVPGGSIVEVARLGQFRPLTGQALLGHKPPIYNPGVSPDGVNFVEDMPLRGLPLLISTTPGAAAVAQQLELNEWAQQAGNPVSYAHLVNHDRVIVQFAKGDRTVPNPTTTAILRAGGLTDRATYYRNDLTGLFTNPHTFLTSITTPVGQQAQAQIAVFFASDGTVVIDPDGPGLVFETPIAGPPPEGLN